MDEKQEFKRKLEELKNDILEALENDKEKKIDELKKKLRMSMFARINEVCCRLTNVNSNWFWCKEKWDEALEFFDICTGMNEQTRTAILTDDVSDLDKLSYEKLSEAIDIKNI